MIRLALVLALLTGCGSAVIGHECAQATLADPELEQATSSLERLASMRGSAPAFAALAMAYTCEGRVDDARTAVARARSAGAIDERVANALADIERRIDSNASRSADPQFRSQVLATERRFSEAQEALRAGTVSAGE